MKKLAPFIFLLLTSIYLEAQTPEKLSYQAIIRNSSDIILANQPIGMQISILQGSSSGIAIYTETQNPSTNANGLISIEIGNGTSSDDFTTIDWSTNTYFVKTEIDPTGGNAYNITSTSQLMSVPYALYAKTSGSSTPGPQGIQGPQGLKGDKGDQGDQGPQGIPGTNGNDVTELPTGGSDGQVLKTDGSGNYTWVDQTTDTNTDTQLTETQVDNYVSDNGYLTSVTESDISGNIAINKITNLQTTLDAKQATIGDDDLSISNTNGLQDALDAKLESIGDGDLTIANTLSLQSALDDKQDSLGDGDLSISYTDGLQDALDTKLETEVDGSITNEIQNLEDVLTESNDANEKSIVNVSKIAVGTDTPNTSAALDINSTTGALLLPRMTATERDNLTPSAGMVIYNTDTDKFQGYANNSTSNLDQSQTGPTSVYYGISNPSNTTQIFTAGITGSLTQVDVYLSAYTNDNAVTINIRDGDDPNGNILFTQTLPTVTTTPQWYSVTITGVSVTLGNKYGIQLKSPNSNSDPGFAEGALWRMYSPGPYTGGKTYRYNSEVNIDASFITHVSLGSSWIDLH